jgi:hypothetical protein
VIEWVQYFRVEKIKKAGKDHHLDNTMLANRSCEVGFAIWMASLPRANNEPPEQPAKYPEEERYFEIMEVENFIQRRSGIHQCFAPHILFRHFLDDFDGGIWFDGADAKQRV